MAIDVQHGSARLPMAVGQSMYAAGLGLGKQQGFQQQIANMGAIAEQGRAQAQMRSDRELGLRQAAVAERQTTVQEQLAELEELIRKGELDLAWERFKEIEVKGQELQALLGLGQLENQRAADMAAAGYRTERIPGAGPFAAIQYTRKPNYIGGFQPTPQHYQRFAGQYL